MVLVTAVLPGEERVTKAGEPGPRAGDNPDLPFVLHLIIDEQSLGSSLWNDVVGHVKRFLPSLRRTELRPVAAATDREQHQDAADQ